MESSARVVIEVDPSDPDPALTERLTANLQRELSLLDTLSEVDRAPAATTPEGTKGADPMTLYVVVTLTTAALSGLVAVTTAWLKRSQARSATLKNGDDTLELTAMSPAEQRTLVEAWITRQIKSQLEKDGSD